MNICKKEAVAQWSFPGQQPLWLITCFLVFSDYPILKLSDSLILQLFPKKICAGYSKIQCPCFQRLVFFHRKNRNGTDGIAGTDNSGEGFGMEFLIVQPADVYKVPVAFLGRML